MADETATTEVDPATVTAAAEATTEATDTTTEAAEEKPLAPAEAAKLKAALKKANEESAARRIELKALKDAEDKRKQLEMTDLEKAQAEATTAKADAIEKDKELARFKAEKSFDVAVKKLTYVFFNDKARDDALAAMDITAPDGFEKALKDYVKERPYALKTVETPDLDAEKKGEQKGPGELTDAKAEELKKRFRIS